MARMPSRERIEARILRSGPDPWLDDGPDDIGWIAEDRAYLDSIRDIAEALPTFDEMAPIARGCPDPDRYADPEGREADL